MSSLEGFVYRTLCVYFDKNRIGCLLFYGDGKYISHRKDVVFGITEYGELNIFDHMELGLFVIDNKDYITEDELKNMIKSLGDYQVGLSEPYRYPYHTKKQNIFNTFIKNNQLKDIKQIIVGDD